MNEFYLESPIITADETTFDKDSDLQFRLLADAIPLIVWTANPNGELDYFNRQAGLYTGLKAEQIKGWGWAQILHPDDLQRCIAQWTAALANGEPYEIEYRFKRAADGVYRWFLGRAVPVKDETGKIIKWFGTSTDIDDQILAKDMYNKAYHEIERVVQERTVELATANQMLARQNEMRKTAVETLQRDSTRLNDIITTQYMLAKAQLDLDEFINLVVERMALMTMANAVVVEMVEGDEMVYKAATGTAAAYLGMRLKMDNSLSGLCIHNRQVLSCTDSESDPRVDLAACRKVNARSLLVAPLFHAGNPIGVLKVMGHQANAFVERDEQALQLMAGLIGAAVGHQTDFEANHRLLLERTEAVVALKSEIDQRILVEAAIRASELRTHMIIESSYDAFVAINDSGVIIDWNQQAEVIFGWARHEAIGVVLADLIIPERYRTKHTEGMKKFCATGTGPSLNKRLELTGLRRSGEEFPLEMTIKSLQYQAQGAYEFCAFLRDITERRATEQRLIYLAQNDHLTGIPNRSLFNDRVIEAMKRCKRSRAIMALLYLDIDHFKSVNDDYGHKIGDGLLQEFSRRLRMSIRATDTVARLGGDEFTILMENLKSRADAETVVSKIVTQVREAIRIDNAVLNVTTSIGIAFYEDSNLDAEQLINNADRALYRAKQAGRNQAIIYQS